MTDSAGLLAAYDSQLRTDAETPGAVSVSKIGPLRLVDLKPGQHRSLQPRETAALRTAVGLQP